MVSRREQGIRYRQDSTQPPRNIEFDPPEHAITEVTTFGVMDYASNDEMKVPSRPAGTVGLVASPTLTSRI